MKKSLLNQANIDDLAREVKVLQEKLKKKNADLTLTRLRLRKAKGTIHRLKEAVSYQRERILELYPEKKAMAFSH